MEIILKQDVQGLGYTNEVVNVKPGYARNFLIPQGKATIANPSNRKMLAEELKQKSFKEEKIRNQAETLAAALKGVTVKIGAKAGETGKIYGSVNTIQVAQAIKEQYKFDIDRKRIAIDGESIKEVGTYKAKIGFHKDVKVEIVLEVFAE